MTKKLCGTFLALAVLHCAFGDGAYEIDAQFHAYNNPSSRLRTRSNLTICCDHSVEVAKCTGGEICDNYFKSCFKEINSDGECISDQFNSSVYDNNDSIEFESGMAISFQREEAWEGIQFFVTVVDVDGNINHTQDIDKFVIDLNTSFLVPGANFTARTVYNGQFEFGMLELSFRLSCAASFFGPDCTTECIPLNSFMTCDEGGNLVCQPGFTGALCTNINECFSNDACGPNGQCVDGVNTLTCQCDSGFTGANCTIDIDECLNNDACGPNGQCVDGVNTFTCQCYSGFAGANCTIDINECCNNDACGPNGQCVDGVNTFTCQCDSGFTGANCTIDIDECFNNDACGPNGRCVDGVNTFTCQCDSGFTGENCMTHIEVNSCGGMNCGNGICINSGTNLFTCQCNAGFAGRFCEKQDNIYVITTGVLAAVLGVFVLMTILAIFLVVIRKSSQQKEKGSSNGVLPEEKLSYPTQPTSNTHSFNSAKAEKLVYDNPVYDADTVPEYSTFNTSTRKKSLSSDPPQPTSNAPLVNGAEAQKVEFDSSIYKAPYMGPEAPTNNNNYALLQN